MKHSGMTGINPKSAQTMSALNKLLRGDRATRMGQEDAMILPVHSRPRRPVSSTTSPMEDDSETVSESMARRLEFSTAPKIDEPSAKIIK